MPKRTKPTIDELAGQLQSIQGASQGEGFVKLVTELQGNIETALGGLLAQLPGRPPGQGHVFFYGRQSKDEKTQLHTRAAQEMQFEEYHRLKLRDLEKRWPPFFDENVSGGVPLFRRPMGSHINEYIRRGDHLVFTKWDRAFRSTRDGLNTLHAFEQRGVFIHVINLGLDMSTPMGKLVVRQLLSFAEFEREMASVRIKEGLVVARAKGRLHNRRAVTYIGWRVLGDRNNRRYVVDEAERRIGELFVSMLKDKYGVEDIYQKMKAMGATAKSGYVLGKKSVRRLAWAHCLGYPRLAWRELEAEVVRRQISLKWWSPRFLVGVPDSANGDHSQAPEQFDPPVLEGRQKAS